MDQYRALRNVCIGPGLHVTPDSEPFKLDAATAQFLTSIGAVAKHEPPAAAPEQPAAAATPEPKPTKDAKASTKKGT